MRQSGRNFVLHQKGGVGENSEFHKTIGLDLDDVLLNFNDALGVYHNREYGTAFERKHITDFGHEKIWQCSRAEAIKRVLAFYQSEDHFNAPPVDGAVEALATLAKTKTLFIVTSKPDTLREITERWVNIHFPKTFQGIYFTNHFPDNNSARTKGEVCVELGVDVFVDDALHHARAVSSVGIPVLLYDTPWNQEPIDPPITRVHSWSEIVEIVNAK